jgi:hypothetical protein
MVLLSVLTALLQKIEPAMSIANPVCLSIATSF